ncbi:MAG: hemoglobin/transferrin/lactoferrin receptor protein [Saprospiraceae bacterium]|jgi:hemoglobin/transferrin/lactoferrin receptor protein
MKGLHLRYICHWLNILLVIQLFLSTSIQAQKVTIVDEYGAPLVGVEVMTRSFAEGVGTITDFDGIVEVAELLKIDSTLTFQFLGYESEQYHFNQLADCEFIISMTPDDFLMDELVIVGRREMLQSEVPYEISTISAKEIKRLQSQTSADALDQQGVYVQKSQMGGGSPIIRGFEANRVLLVIDGVRMNNAIYRNGHIQNAVTVDQAILDRMEVIFGPNSLMYGSDALGGVVHFQTKDPKLALGDEIQTEGQFYTRYSSANHERSGHFDLSVAGKKMGSLTSFTMSKYGDLRTGNKRDKRFPTFGLRPKYQGDTDAFPDIAIENENPNVQVGTGYNQYDLLQKFLYVPNQYNRLSANIQYSTSSDVPRYDNLSEVRDGELRWAEWNYGPQKRFLTSVDYRYLKPSAITDEIILIAAYQRIDEDRISRRWQQSLREIQNEDVSVFSVTLDMSKRLGSSQRMSLDYGADWQANRVESSARGIDIVSDQIDTGNLSRYASGDNHYANYGVFATIKGSDASKQWHYQGGARYSITDYKISYNQEGPVDWPAEFYNGVNGNNSAFTWSVGGSWNGEKGTRVRSMVSTAFRSPNIDDLSKIRVNSSEITFPNLDLKPERSFNAEIGISKSLLDKSLQLSSTLFYTKLSDAIVRKEGFGPQGQREWITAGDTLKIVANQNAQNASIKGVNFTSTYNVSHQLKLSGTINYTKGRELNTGESIPLGHIPPIYGYLNAFWSPSDYEFSLRYRFNGHKPLSEYGGSVDNPDLTTADGALAWQTFNLYTVRKFGEQFRISLAVENIFDKHYRNFGSGVSASGRNVILGLSGTF